MLLLLTDNAGDAVIVNSELISSVDPIRKFERSQSGSIVKMNNGSEYLVPQTVHEFFQLITRIPTNG